MSEGTLEPTPKRLERARREGDLGASGAPASALVTFAFVLALPALAGAIAAAARADLTATLVSVEAPSPDTTTFDAKTLVTSVLLLAAPVAAVAAVVAVVTTLLETRFGFSFEKLGGSKSEGGSRPFLIPFSQSLGAGALGLVLTLGALVVSTRAVTHTSLTRPKDMAERAAKVTTYPLRALVAVSIVGALGATFASIRSRNARLRMTHREVEEERKAGEGDPEVKAARKRVAETVFSEVPLRGLPRATSACVVGHDLAVVVSWNKDVDAAPRLLRKLRGKDSERLEREARLADLAAHHDAALCDDIASRVAVGQLVPEVLYDPIATLFSRIT